MITDDQLTANQQNALNSTGPMTPEGKEISKFNATTHGILRQSLTEYEEGIYQNLLQDLLSEFDPKGIMETILVERIALSYLRLFRVAKVEKEYVLSQLNPHIETESNPFEDMLVMGEKKVIQEGYTPKIRAGSIQQIDQTILRYETTIERSLYRALHELQRVQAVRMGEKPPIPVAVDITVDNPLIEQNGTNGFVSQNTDLEVSGQQTSENPPNL